MTKVKNLNEATRYCNEYLKTNSLQDLVDHINHIRGSRNTIKKIGLVNEPYMIKGLGLKLMGRLLYKWLIRNHPKLAFDNLIMYLIHGCFKDLISTEFLVERNYWINIGKVCELIETALELDSNHPIKQSTLKYLICNNLDKKSKYHKRFSSKLRSYLGCTPEKLRSMKAVSMGHHFQRVMSNNVTDIDGSDSYKSLDIRLIPCCARINLENKLKTSYAKEYEAFIERVSSHSTKSIVTTVLSDLLQDKILKSNYPFDAANCSDYNIAVLKRLWTKIRNNHLSHNQTSSLHTLIIIDSNIFTINNVSRLISLTSRLYISNNICLDSDFEILQGDSLSSLLTEITNRIVIDSKVNDKSDINRSLNDYVNYYLSNYTDHIDIDDNETKRGRLIVLSDRSPVTPMIYTNFEQYSRKLCASVPKSQIKLDSIYWCNITDSSSEIKDEVPNYYVMNCKQLMYCLAIPNEVDEDFILLPSC